MFDFAWSEIALIGIVALVAIGPKDLPVAIKAVAGMIKKARKMAGEFQVHVDEMVREADLHEVRQEFNDLRRMDIKGKILNAMDGDGTLRKTMAENPLAASTTLTTPPPLAEVEVPPPADHTIAAPDTLTPDTLAPDTLAPDTLAPDAAAPDTVVAGPAATHPLAPASLTPAPEPVPAAPAPAVASAVAPASVAHPAPLPDAAPSMTHPADAKQPSLHG